MLSVIRPFSLIWVLLFLAGRAVGQAIPETQQIAEPIGIWGGYAGGTTNTGGQYDPADSWTITDLNGAPSPRYLHAAVWTGSRMIVWGGSDSTGGRYDPVGNGWSSTTTAGAPPTGGQLTAVWTGSKMIVWGGGFLDTGGQYSVLSLYVKN